MRLNLFVVTGKSFADTAQGVFNSLDIKRVESKTFQIAQKDERGVQGTSSDGTLYTLLCDVNYPDEYPLSISNSKIRGERATQDKLKSILPCLLKGGFGINHYFETVEGDTKKLIKEEFRLDPQGKMAHKIQQGVCKT